MARDVTGTLYAACLARLGLSQAEAAELHGVRPDTVKSWAAGRRRPPAGAYDDLRAYAGEVNARARAMRETWAAEGEPLEAALSTHEVDDITLIADADFVLGLPAGVRIVDTADALDP